MALEIEHKYLVHNLDFKRFVTSSNTIIQGYLSKDKQRTVRVRIYNDDAFITVKGQNQGATRLEFEYSIPVSDAKVMLDSLCHKPVINKTRHIVFHEGNKWEIDEFHGALQGLILAEIEIPTADYAYNVPSFIGKNITGDAKYYNSNLCELLAPPVD